MTRKFCCLTLYPKICLIEQFKLIVQGHKQVSGTKLSSGSNRTQEVQDDSVWFIRMFSVNIMRVKMYSLWTWQIGWNIHKEIGFHKNLEHPVQVVLNFMTVVFKICLCPFIDMFLYVMYVVYCPEGNPVGPVGHDICADRWGQCHVHHPVHTLQWPPSSCTSWRHAFLWKVDFKTKSKKSQYYVDFTYSILNMTGCQDGCYWNHIFMHIFIATFTWDLVQIDLEPSHETQN